LSEEKSSTPRRLSRTCRIAEKGQQKKRVAC
jgi:hypothetical protein